MRKLFARSSISLLLTASAMLSPYVSASSDVSPITTQCLVKIGKAYSIHTDILLAILIVEGGTVGRNSKSNDNGSYDIGPFQINTTHRATLAKMGISENDLRNDGCLNAAVAAWHLKRVLTPTVMSKITNDDDYLRAIARYHSATPQYNEIYANKLRAAFAYLYAKE